MTTKERCLEILKDNEFFQSAMKEGKMVLVTHKYEPWVVEEGFMFGNQYNAINSQGNKERIYDTALCCIFNDKRLNDFYVCEQGQGTFEECQQKINDYRSKIKKCKTCGKDGGKCFYWRALKTLSSDTQVIYDDTTNQETNIKTTVVQYGCDYKDYTNSEQRCVFDIDSTPHLCTESWHKDFFVQHPEGIPDQMPLRDFLARHADEFNITSRRWSESVPTAHDGFRYDGKFGSYTFEACSGDDRFVLENNNNCFYFRYDLVSHNFIVGRQYRDIGYNVTRRFEESKWDHTQQKSVSRPIACWDKFIQWWHSVIDAYLSERVLMEMGGIML